MATQSLSNALPNSAVPYGKRCLLSITMRNCQFAERWQTLSLHVLSLPSDDLGNLVLQKSKAGRKLSGLIVDLLDCCTGSTERALALRLFINALPEHLSCIRLPDGTRAVISGHALDRLMTRFNVSSPIHCLQFLHSNSERLELYPLSPFKQIAQRIRYSTDATHWRYENHWTLIIVNGAVVTAYYPKNPHFHRIAASRNCVGRSSWVTYPSTSIH